MEDMTSRLSVYKRANQQHFLFLQYDWINVFHCLSIDCAVRYFTFIKRVGQQIVTTDLYVKNLKFIKFSN